MKRERLERLKELFDQGWEAIEAEWNMPPFKDKIAATRKEAEELWNELLEEPGLKPLLPPAPQLPAGQTWKPERRGKGKWQNWQAVREIRSIGGGVTKIHDTVIDYIGESGEAVRRCVTFSTELACQIRCDELNRRRSIGGLSPNPPMNGTQELTR